LSGNDNDVSKAVAVMESPQIAEIKRAAIKYWETRRIVYNACLVLPALLGFHGGATAAARDGLVRDGGTGMVILLFALWMVYKRP
jgi:hypothetical protein